MTIAHPGDGMRTAAFPAGGRSDTARLYRAAMRHSRHVHWLRRAVPVGIAAVLLTVVAINYMPSLGAGLRLPGELGKLVIKGTKITMAQPRLSGFTADSRAYEFSADAAAQDITKPDFVELQKLHAKMAMEDRSTVEMSAASGLYDVKTEILKLKDDINLVSSTGYEGRLSEAEIDVQKGNVVSDKPVWVKLLNGFLNAQRLEIVDHGDVLRFSDVAMTLQPGKDGERGDGQPADREAEATGQ